VHLVGFITNKFVAPTVQNHNFTITMMILIVGAVNISLRKFSNPHAHVSLFNPPFKPNQRSMNKALLCHLVQLCITVTN